jgi:predicted enzyme related to lactoylglutathione lyase
MAKATGLGGVFYRVTEPATTVAWYAEHLGIEPEDDYPCAVLRSSGGETAVWAPFGADTEYFGELTQNYMVNFRVDDLDALLAQLRASGIDVDDNIEDSEAGRFGWAVDCDGFRFEMWQPPAGQ